MPSQVSFSGNGKCADMQHMLLDMTNIQVHCHVMWTRTSIYHTGNTGLSCSSDKLMTAPG